MGWATRIFDWHLAKPLVMCSEQPGFPIATTSAPVERIWPTLRSSSLLAISGWVML